MVSRHLQLMKTSLKRELEYLQQILIPQFNYHIGGVRAKIAL
jgi:hypothetical protein